RHGDVQDCHLWREAADFSHGLPAVRGSTDNLHVRLRIQQSCEAVTHDRVIIGQENGDRGHALGHQWRTGQLNSMPIRVPAPGVAARLNRAPMASARSRMVVVPMPYPPMTGLRVVSKPVPLSTIL